MSRHTSGYIDLHSHILPCVDDGALSVCESVEMAKGLAELGFDHVIATPHHAVASGVPPVGDWTRALALIFYSSPAPVITIEIAAENRVEGDDPFAFYGDKSVCYPSYPHDHSYLLVDIKGETDRVPKVLEETATLQIAPVWAHPERHIIGSIPVSDICASGIICLPSLTSLGGYHGTAVASRAVDMVYRMYEDAPSSIAIGTDIHGTSDLVYVEQGLALLEDTVGRDGVDILMVKNPEKILGLRGEEKND